MARDPSRDVLRGLNVLEMAFVNICSLPWTNHAGYIDQPTYADNVFPCFAFIAGMSRTSSQRSVSLVGLGLGLNVLSAWKSGDKLRIPGVLQRLGLASLLANTASLELLSRFCGLPFVALWYLVSFGLGPLANPFAHPDYAAADPGSTAQTKIDSFFFGDRIYTPSYDPEGLLGALTTAVSMVVGRQFVLQKFKTTQQVLLGISAVAAGEILHLFIPRYCPISKSLWTPSFVLITSGLSILKFVAVRQTLPYWPSFLSSSLEEVGKRSLETYLLSSIIELYLQAGGHKSWWFTVMSQLEPMFGRSISDVVMSLGFTAIMAQAAKLLVRNDWKMF